LLPKLQEKKTFRTTLLEKEKRKTVMQQVSEINTAISNKETLQQNWDEFIQQNSKQYLNSFAPTNAIGNHYFRAGFNRLGIGKIFINKQYLKLILNLMRCEAHADAIKSTIKEYLKGTK